MNRINSFAARPVHMLLLLLLVGVLPACRKVEIKQLTTEDVNIVDYMKKHPETFSEYLKVLERTNISPYLNAYGTYTCFAPTNEAFKVYLQQTGKTSTDQMDTSALLSLCRLHLIQDTIPTRSFSDGKMPTPTLYGQYLISSVDDGGVTRVNRQANISQANILTGNGYIHVIDRVLQPATLTLAKMVEQNARYAIFTQALKSTGFYDSLNIENNPDTTRRWLTLLAESDSVLRVAGINSYPDLVRKYNKTGNPRNPEDSLYLYVAYHVLPGIKYVADIVSAPSHPTLAPLNVVTAELSGQSVLINQAIFNGIPEAGIPVDRASSDNSATNGVLHNLTGDIYIKIRTPVGVYWDIADQPEIRKNVSVFRKVGKNMNLTYGLLADITWQYTPAVFSYTSVSSTSADFYYYNDLIAFNLRTPANQNNWIEFTTPLLVKGKYKVWICFRRSNQGAYTQVSFNGNPLSRIVDMNASYPTANSEAVNESQGYKRYMYEAAANNSTSGIAELAGVIDVPTTDRHKLRMTAIKDFGSSGNSVTMDMIQFIPIDMDQQWPRFARDGTIRYQP